MRNVSAAMFWKQEGPRRSLIEHTEKGSSKTASFFLAIFPVRGYNIGYDTNA